jgi:hypothetical protein
VEIFQVFLRRPEGFLQVGKVPIGIRFWHADSGCAIIVTDTEIHLLVKGLGTCRESIWILEEQLKGCRGVNGCQ